MNTKKNLFILFVGLSSTLFSQGNVGINTSTPHPSAILDVFSTDKGFLPPRLTTVQRDAITSKAEGLLIYNSDTNCIQYWNGTSWVEKCTSDPDAVASFLGSDPGTLSGTFQEGQALTPADNLVLPVDVTQTGSWDALSDTLNGIYFTGHGTFVTTGPNTVTLTGNGTPTASGTFIYPITLTTLGSSTRTRSINFNDAPPPAPDLTTSCTGFLLPYTANNGTASGTINGLPVTATFSEYVRVIAGGLSSVSTIPASGCGATTPTMSNNFVLGGTATMFNGLSSMKINFNRKVSNLKINMTAVNTNESSTFTLKNNGVTVSPAIQLSPSGTCNSNFTVNGTTITLSSGNALVKGLIYNIGGVWFDEIVFSHTGVPSSGQYGGSSFNFCVGAAK